MAPLDTNEFVTAWVPLRRIRGQPEGPAAASPGAGAPAQNGGRRPPPSPRRAPAVQSPDEMVDSGLLFASGSHRDFALPFWHDLSGMDLSTRGYQIRHTGE